MHLTREELAANEEDVGQAPRFVDVTKCPPCLRWSLGPLDVVKLTIHQVDANDRHGLLQTPLVPLDDFGVRIGWWSILRPVQISQRSMEANTISILNFQRLKFSPLNLSMTLVLSPSKDAILHSNPTSLPTYVLNQMLISA